MAPAGDGPAPWPVRVVGHRGACAQAPENTLAGLRQAAADGVGWVEIDTKLTADGVPVVLHDDTLDRTTDGSGALAETPLARLRQLDAGSWFDPAFAGAGVPTLGEALEELIRLELGLYLELKPNPGEAEQTATAALGLARSMWPANWPAPILASFTPACLAQARAVVPAWPRAPIFAGLPAGWKALCESVAAVGVNLDQHRVDAPTADAVKAHDYVLGAYTVDDPYRAETLFARGVDAVVSDRPGPLQGELPAS